MTTKRNDNVPDQSLLNRLFSYDPSTGELTWLPRTPDLFSDNRFHTAEMQCAIWNKRHAGEIAFQNNVKGYKQGMIFGKPVLAHRIIWKLIYGTDARVIDHINGKRNDNRLENLRNGSQQDNMRNQKGRAATSSGVCGVTWHKRLRKWQAQIKANGKNNYLGVYDRLTEAVDVRNKASIEYGFSQNHGQPQPIREATQ